MDIGSVFLILGILLLAALYVGRPFFSQHSSLSSEDERHYSALLAERDRVLNALQELDFDFALGKIPEAEYPTQRTLLLQKGAEILRQVDAYETESAHGDIEARIEAAIAARRADESVAKSVANGTGTRSLPVQPDDDIEKLIATRRRVRNGRASGFCPQCGKPVQQSDQFCPNCGTTIG